MQVWFCGDMEIQWKLLGDQEGTRWIIPLGTALHCQPPLLCLQGEAGGAGTTLQDMWGSEPSLRVTPAQQQGASLCSCPRTGLLTPAPHGNKGTPCALQNKGAFCWKAPRIPANKGLFLFTWAHFARFLSKIHHCYCRCTTLLVLLELITTGDYLPSALSPNQTLEIHTYSVHHYKILHLILYQKLISCASHTWMCWPHLLNIWKSQLGLSLIPLFLSFTLRRLCSWDPYVGYVSNKNNIKTRSWVLFPLYNELPEWCLQRLCSHVKQAGGIKRGRAVFYTHLSAVAQLVHELHYLIKNPLTVMLLSQETQGAAVLLHEWQASQEVWWAEWHQWLGSINP